MSKNDINHINIENIKLGSANNVNSEKVLKIMKALPSPNEFGCSYEELYSIIESNLDMLYACLNNIDVLIQNVKSLVGPKKISNNINKFKPK